MNRMRFSQGGILKQSLPLILGLALLLTAPNAFAQAKNKAKGKTTTETAKKSGKPSTTETPPSDPMPTPTPMMSETAPIEPVPSHPAKNVDPETRSDSYYGFNFAFGVPHPLQVGLNYVHESHVFTGELEFGSFGVSAGDVKFGMTNFELAGRWHPFEGSFFVGAALGQQKIAGEATDAISGQSIFAKIDVNTTYLTPHVGWLWGAMNGGFFGSIDLGYQAAMSASASLTTNADPAVKATTDYKDLDKKARDAGQALGEIGLPRLTFKVGWLF